MRKILLVADAGGEIGWGHAMRMLAVAEELAGRSGRQAVWVTETPREVHSLKPPIAIYACGPHEGMNPQHATADAVLIDLPGEESPGFWEYDANDYRLWHMVDHGTGLKGTNRICPHFGAEDRDWGPGAVVCGPRWMPLREEFIDWRPFNRHATRYDPEGKVLAYRANDAVMQEISDRGEQAHRMHGGYKWWTEKWSGAVVPASTIAYECMVLGIPVALLPLPNDQPNDVGEAMIQAGVARWWDSRHPSKVEDRIAAARAAVDGRGAERVADLLERW